MEENAGKAIDKAAKLTGLDKRSGYDHLRAGIIALLNLIPGIGSLLSDLATTYVPEQKQKRILSFVEDIAGQLQQIEDSIDKDYITTEEFAFIFESTFRRVSENYQQERLECFRNILLNSTINPQDVSQEEREIFLQIVENLTTRHVLFLKVLRNPIEYDEQTGNRVGKGGGGGTTALMSIYKKLFPEYDEGSISYVVSSLTAMGLCVEQRLKGMMSNEGIHHLTGKLTDTGQKFVKFVLTFPME